MGENQGNNEDFVKLHVYGAPAIVKTSFLAMAKLDENWYSFLARAGVKLSPKDGVYVRTKNAKRVSAGGEDRAFSAELHEPILEFVQKFGRKHKLHVVRLMFKDRRRGPYKKSRTSNVQPKTRVNSIPVATASKRRQAEKGGNGNRQPTVGPSIVVGTGPSTAGVTTTSEPKGIYNRPRYTPAYTRKTTGRQRIKYGTRLRSRIEKSRASKGNSFTAVNPGLHDSGVKGNKNISVSRRQRRMPACALRNRMIRSPTPHIDNSWSFMKQEVDLEEDSNSSLDENGAADRGGVESGNSAEDQFDREDNMNVGGMEGEEREEDQEKDVMVPAQRGLEGFSNPFLQKVGDEIRELRENNSWDMCVFLSPLACYVLQEMLNK